MANVLQFIRNCRAAAAAEMALIMPLLLVLMFAFIEIGNYFFQEHLVIKAVRDGARFAGRQSFASMPCGTASSAETQIKNLVRYGNTAGSGNPRISNWTNANTITVTIACDTTGSYSSAGLFTGLTGGARRVTVAATVPYQSLAGSMGFPTPNLNIVARSQAVVAGL